ncbi:BQ5605_C004g02725 [Microbotryum silenes-dioicae]|uniref:BQ5605_C004g02725 protein n=1 Tax=Microbotryum silenes-dioicae TaxID=796604 RepID=A0A2X0PAZ9_9BASI|nr:BQ5605_C004g02725 [Microbotryum silenes-dioicae]
MAQMVDSSNGTQRFVIGKIDAGIAVLISDSVHLIEFPSLLLPAGVGPGSIVNIACTRNFAAEKEAYESFWSLQRDIYSEFGAKEPKAPTLRVRNTTQTSEDKVTLEWDKLELASAKLLQLSVWRNGQRLTTIPNPQTNTSTKLSGLALDTDYNFHLVLKTSAGTYTSPTVKTRTHTITDTSGISVCFGLIEPEAKLAEAKSALAAMKAKYSDKIQIDTTHFVATSPASASNPTGGPSVEYQKALQLSIPVVSPEWVIACQKGQTMVPISNYYIGTVNHAASISSAQLVTSTGAIPSSKPSTRRATTTTPIAEEGPSSSAPVPAVAPTASTKGASALAEEEPEGPPGDERGLDGIVPTAEGLENRRVSNPKPPRLHVIAPSQDIDPAKVDALVRETSKVKIEETVAEEEALEEPENPPDEDDATFVGDVKPVEEENPNGESTKEEDPKAGNEESTSAKASDGMEEVGL